MSTEARSVLATAFAIAALFAALVSSAVTGYTAIDNSKQIQNQRQESIVTFCRTQNVRNRKAYVFLQGLPVNPRSPKLTPKERTRLIHGFTDALVGPIHADCNAYAKSLTD